MSLRWVLAALHLLGLGIGLGAIWARARGLRGPLDTAGIRRVLEADTWWGIAALVWIVTGMARGHGAPWPPHSNAPARPRRLHLPVKASRTTESCASLPPAGVTTGV